MADDNLFSETGAPEAGPRQEGFQDGAGPGGSELDGKLDNLKEELVGALGSVAAGVNALNQRVEGLETPAPAPEDQAPEDPTDSFRELYADPDKKIGDVALQRVRAEIAPTLMPIYNDRADDNINEQREAIVSQFGNEVWDQYFKPALDTMQNQWTPELKASRHHVSTAVQAIYGNLHQQPELREKLEGARQAKVAADTPAPSPPEFVSGYRSPIMDANALSSEEKEFVSRLKDSGIDTDEKRYLAARNKGTNLADWQTKEGSN